MRNNRGFLDPVTLTVLGVACLLGVAWPSARPWNWFKKDQVKAASTDLAKATADLAKAQSDAKTAQDALADARAAELAHKDAQTRYAQEMTTGAAKALETAPPSPPVALAQSLLGRANPALVAALGSLPESQQQEILTVVAQSLSGVTDQLAQANTKLAALDKSLAITSAERDSLKRQIPVLESQVTAKDAQVIQATATVAQKQTALVSVAEKVQAEIKANGGLGAQVDNLGRLLLVCGILYIIAHVCLPCLAQQFPASKILQGINGTVTSLVSAHEITDQSVPPKT